MKTITKSQMNQVTEINQASKTAWVTVESDKVVGVYSNRTQARDAKNGKVYKFLEVEAFLTVEAETSKLKTKRVKKDFWEDKLRKSTVKNPTGVAKELVANMYGKAKPKEIFNVAYTQGIAYLTVLTMYQQYRESLK